MFPIYNSKHISSFSTGSSITSKEGYLLKKGDHHKVLKNRWFVLKGNILFYFERRDSYEPIGLLILECCNIDVCTEQNFGDRFCFQIQFIGGTTLQRCSDRVYILAADTQASMESWMFALSTASQIYSRKIVAAYKKRLNFLDTKLLLEEKCSAVKERHNPFGDEKPAAVKKLSHFHLLHAEYGLQINPWVDLFALD